VVPTTFNTYFVSDGAAQLKMLLNQAKALSAKYDVMITNPPYIGISSMEGPVKDYASKNYPNSKTDMFAMFMENSFVKPNGFIAMINMHSWMFLSSYERLRGVLLSTKEIVTMAHLGARAFEAIGGEVVQTTSFVMRNSKMGGNATYFRLVDSLDKESDFLSAIVS
jgi:type I restriction-modification system DNA methylase subunit